MVHERLRCGGGSCPLRQDCVRYRAAVYGRQDFFGAPPFDPVTSSCAHQVPLHTLAPSHEAIREAAYHRWRAAGSPEGHAEAFWYAAEAALRAHALAALAPAHERP
ncbi:MAG: DUF2934 domain-containing protein [Polyangiales bacterium]